MNINFNPNVHTYKRKFNEVEGKKESPQSKQAKVTSQFEKIEVAKQDSALNLKEKLLINPKESKKALSKIALAGLNIETKDSIQWVNLPLDMQKVIFSKMDLKDLGKMRQVSKNFKNLSDFAKIKLINDHQIPLTNDDIIALNLNIEEYGIPFTYIKASLKNHGKDLKYLELQLMKDEEEFVNLIEACPYLEHIKLHGCNHLYVKVNGKILNTHQFDDAFALRLAECLNASKLPYLKTLEFTHRSIGLEGVKAIVEAPLNSLISLKLSQNDLDDQAIDYICNSPNLTKLRVLDFSSNRITSKGLAAIVAKFKLTELYLGENLIDSLPNNLENLTHVKILNLRENRLTSGNLEGIVELSKQALTFLDLSHNQLNDSCIPDIVQSSSFKLLELDLSHNVLTSQGIKKILPLISQLSILRLDHNKKIGHEGLELILQAQPKLIELGLSYTTQGDKGAKKIFNFEHFRHIRKLAIGGNHLSREFYNEISTFKQMESHLEILGMGDNDLQNTDALKLAQSPLFANLQEIDISDNPLDVDGTMALLNSLKHLKRMTTSSESSDEESVTEDALIKWGESLGCEIEYK